VAGFDIGLEEHLGVYAMDLQQHEAWHDDYSAIWYYVPKQSAPMLLEHGIDLELESFSPKLGWKRAGSVMDQSTRSINAHAMFQQTRL